MMTVQMRATGPPDADVSINEPENDFEFRVRGARQLFDDETECEGESEACRSRTGAHRSERDRDSGQDPTLP